MDPMRRYPFLGSFLGGFERRHQKTVGLVIAAIAATGQARSFAIATTMSRWLGIQLGSAVNRFYRLLRNRRIDELGWTGAWARQLVRRADKHLLVGVDWTEWSSGMRMLVAAVVVGKRAVPLAARAFTQKVWRGSQNRKEGDFLRMLSAALHQAGLKATLLCDRGFRRVSWLKLIETHRLQFVVRLMDDVHVHVGSEHRALASMALQPGKLLDLGEVPIRSDAKMTVRVVGYRARGAKETWWLATNRKDPADAILSLYDRRMTIEEQFRDIKGKRFGVKLAWTRFRDPEQLARFVLLLAVALLIWMLEGLKAATRNRSLRLTCRQKGPRQSYVTIGLRISVLDRAATPLTSRSLKHWLPEPALRNLLGSSLGK